MKIAIVLLVVVVAIAMMVAGAEHHPAKKAHHATTQHKPKGSGIPLERAERQVGALEAEEALEEEEAAEELEEEELYRAPLYPRLPLRRPLRPQDLP